MAEDKKISTEETEKNIKDEEKKDSLDALLLDDDDEDYGETSDEAEFDAFMAEYRDLIGKKLNEAATAEPETVEEENPEEVLISLPKKQSKKKKERPEKKVSCGESDWNEEITLVPEEYEDPGEDERDMLDELPEEEAAPDFDLGEETDDGEDRFQISINFDGERRSEPTEESDDGEVTVRRYDPERPRAIDWVFDIAEMFVFVLLAVMILTSFVFRHSIVEGHSMMNTLEDGDHLIISDLFYTPERGDIIVFEDYSTSLKKAVVKRVIGLPGDTVEVRLNELGEVIVYVNGELLAEEYAVNAKDCDIDTSNFNRPITVGDGEVFVMGDNRYHSTDSRSSGVGPVKTDAILGKVIIRFFPFDKFGTVE